MMGRPSPGGGGVQAAGRPPSRVCRRARHESLGTMPPSNASSRMVVARAAGRRETWYAVHRLLILVSNPWRRVAGWAIGRRLV